MKKIYKYIGLFAFAGILFTSCDSDDGTGDSIIDYTTTTVTLTSSMNDLIVDESSLDADDLMTITVTASIASPLPVDLRIPLTTLAGSTGGSDDYSVDGDIVIPSSATSGSTTVTIEKTGDIEGDESLVIGAGTVANANVNPFALNINITDDYINGAMDFIFAWDGSATDDTVTIETFCDIDFDVVLYDGGFNYLGYIAGSADCPEEFTMDGFPDGTYYLVSDLYDNPFSGFGFTDVIPLSLSWSQDYFDNSGTLTSDGYTLSDASGLGNFIVAVTVSGGYNYTVELY